MSNQLPSRTFVSGTIASGMWVRPGTDSWQVLVEYASGRLVDREAMSPAAVEAEARRRGIDPADAHALVLAAIGDTATRPRAYTG